MSIAGFRRQFESFGSAYNPPYVDFTDPEDFIVYSNDIGATILFDHVVGFSQDGTYYIRYDFEGGATIDSENAGMWMEYRYTRSNGGNDRVIHSRIKVSPLVDPTNWKLETPSGGNSATEVYLSAAMSVRAYIRDLQEEYGDGVEEKVPGAWTVTRTIYDGPTNNGSEEVAEFELRSLVIKDLRADKPRFDPSSEESNTYFKCEVLALPVGWQPAQGEAFIYLQAVESSGLFIGIDDGFELDVNPHDSTGKISEVSIPWDGTSTYSSPFNSPEPMEGVFNVRSRAYTLPVTTTNAYSFFKYTQVQSVRCKCRCSDSHLSGMHFVSFSPGDLVSTALGPPIQLTLSYCSKDPEAAPSSMGYGWRSNGSVRVFENSVDGSISYRTESGDHLLWKLQGLNYVAVTSDNFVQLEKTSDPSATYVLTFRDQSRRIFDADGRLQQDLDRNDNALTYAYNGSGHLDTITDASGAVVSFDYTGRSDGQPVAIHHGSRSITFSYDSNHRLQQITNAGGETTSFEYNSEGLLWKVLDTRSEQAAVYLYDNYGRIVSETSYGLSEKQTLYDQNASDLADSLGWNPASLGVIVATITTDLTATSPSPQAVQFFLFNPVGNVVETAELVETGVFNVTRFEYNAHFSGGIHLRHLVTRVIHPNLSTTRYEYNAKGDIRRIIDDHQNIRFFDYTEDVDLPPLNPKHSGLIRRTGMDVFDEGNYSGVDLLEYRYDAQGNLEIVRDQDGKETTFARHSNGLVQSITDRRGNTTSFTYRSDQRLETVTTPAGPSGPSRTITLGYDAFGNVNSVTDPLNHEVLYEFDALDRLIEVTDPLGNSVTLNYVDGLLDSIVAPPNQGSGSNTRTTRFAYDSAGRLTLVESEIDVNTFQKRVGYAYTGFSQLRQLSRLQNSLDKAANYQYDRLGRLTSSSDFLARTTQVEHAPFCTENVVNTPRGIRRRSTYDTLCRLVNVQTEDANEDQVTERQIMEYDALGQLLKVSHGAVYAALDSEVTPPTLKGGRYQKSAFASTTRFVYDSRRRVTSTIHNGATTAFEYDDEANLTRLLPPLGGKTDYEYYNDGRLYKVKHEATPDDWREYTYEYDDAGRLLRIEYPGGMHAHFTKPDGSPGWDANGQLLCLRYVRGNGSHFYSFEYQYDESGNRVQMVESPEDSNDAITWDYQYDWLNRLVGVTRNGNPWRFYVYDESDNRIELSWPEDPENDPYQLTTWSYSHDEGDQLLSYSLVDGVNTQLIEEFTYDEDGNMIARVKDSQTTHYDWDHNNRLKRIRPDGQDPRYLHYDAGGIRDKRTLSGQKETFHTLSGVALADVRPTGPVAFVQGHQLLGLVKDGDLYHFISDGLGTVRWVTDDAVNPVASFTCDPFGNPDPGGTSGNPDFLQHTYTGALGVRNDGAALGLYYAQQRYYDADLGRWLTPDPIGFSGGLNLYTAMDNDPVNFVDPDGLKIKVDIADPRERKLVESWLVDLKSKDCPAREAVLALESDSRLVTIKSGPTKSGFVGYTETVLSRNGNKFTAGPVTLTLDFNMMKTKKVQKECGGKSEVILGHELGHAHTFFKNALLAYALKSLADQGANVRGYPLDEAYVTAKYEEPVRKYLGVKPLLNAKEVLGEVNKILHQVGVPGY